MRHKKDDDTKAHAVACGTGGQSVQRHTKSSPRLLEMHTELEEGRVWVSEGPPLRRCSDLGLQGSKNVKHEAII